VTHGGVVVSYQSAVMEEASLLHPGRTGYLAPTAITTVGGAVCGGGLAWLLWGGTAGILTVSVALVASALMLSRRATVRAGGRSSEADRSARLERAAATASRALLKHDVADPVGTALAALLAAVDVSAVFLETNSTEPPDHLGNTATVRDILYAGDGSDPGRWELTGWRVGVEAKEALGAGLGHQTHISGLDRTTVNYYRAMQIRTEVLLPITIEETWVGSVGFMSHDRDRIWSEDEVRLLTTTAEMIGAYWERRDAKAKLEELLAAKDEFIASVSHEVRTPLTAVLGFAAELDAHADEFSSEERAELISLMAEQSREVASIVDDLLLAARAESGTVVIVPEIVSVRKLVGDVLCSHPRRADFVAHDDIDAWADPGRVRQILRHLLTNADRRGGDSARLHVHRTGDGMVRLEVRDNGSGIPRHLHDHVFEPYARDDSNPAEVASLGLGISVAKRLARLMNGDLVLSEQDGWTVFTLLLPVALESAAAC